MRVKSATPYLFVVSLAVALAGCRPASETGFSGAVPEGLQATVKADGYLFDLEVTQVEGMISTFVSRWGDKIVGKHKLYRGFYPFTGYEDGVDYSFEFDVKHVESLFPLSVSKEVSFEESYRDGRGEEQTYWVTLEVAGEAEIYIQKKLFDVFVIDITTDLEVAGKHVRYQKRVWYSDKLGMSLKSHTKSGDRESYTRVMSVTMPEEGKENERPQRDRGLGTIMI